MPFNLVQKIVSIESRLKKANFELNINSKAIARQRWLDETTRGSMERVESVTENLEVCEFERGYPDQVICYFYNIVGGYSQ